MKRRGWTLTEMLVVLAIVGLLASLSLAVFSRVREKGRRATCQSNLRQIALAMQQYVHDNDSCYPPLRYIAPCQFLGWNSAIMPFIKDNAVFRCPTRQTINPENPATDYNYNWTALNGTSESSIAFPSRVFLTAEGGPSSYDNGPDTDVIDTSWAGPIWQPALHSGGANFSYIDGHVKWRSMQEQLSAE